MNQTQSQPFNIAQLTNNPSLFTNNITNTNVSNISPIRNINHGLSRNYASSHPLIQYSNSNSNQHRVPFPPQTNISNANICNLTIDAINPPNILPTLDNMLNIQSIHTTNNNLNNNRSRNYHDSVNINDATSSQRNNRNARSRNRSIINDPHRPSTKKFNQEKNQKNSKEIEIKSETIDPSDPITNTPILGRVNTNQTDSSDSITTSSLSSNSSISSTSIPSAALGGNVTSKYNPKTRQNSTTNPTKETGDIKSNFECLHCKKLFKRQDSLKSHLKIHLGTAYKCEYCNKLFSRKSNLNQHLLIHTKSRPFECGYCDKLFRQKHAYV